jgi:hypothetical protein
MRSRLLHACLLIVCTATPGVALGQASAPDVPAPVTIPRVAKPPVLEDYLDGGARPGVAITEFRQRSPKDLDPATEKTTAYVAYDESALYAALVCETRDPSKIRAHLEKREDIFSDDFAGIFIDTFRDKQRAYEFLANPIGIQADGVTSAGSGDDFSFDTEWRSEGRLTGHGYVLLLAIPFRSLRFPTLADGTPAVWNLAILRSIPANDEQDFWPAITNRISNFMAQFGTVSGMTGIAPGRNVELTPYGTFTGVRFLDSGASAYATSRDVRAGLDAKFVAKGALTFDLTLNPDFSQVESDDPQVTVNQRFEVFFPEKRPFFLENADYFNDMLQTLVFSRRIVDPQYGGRMTGKVGHWAIGALVTDDRAPGGDSSDGGDGTGRRALNGVFRLRRDFDNNARVGFLGTVRTYGSDTNGVGEVDARVQFSKAWVLSAQGVASSTTAAGVHTAGLSTALDLSRSGRLFTYELSYFDASPNFTTALGYVPRVDYRQLTDFFTLRWYPKSGPIIDFGPNSFAQAVWDWGGTLRDWLIRLPFNVDLKGQSNLFGRHSFSQETVNGVVLREREDLIQFTTAPVGWLSFDTSIGHGTRPNYDPAPGLLPFLGTYTDIAAGLTVRPRSALAFDETYFYSVLRARADSPGQGTVFTNPILRSRVNYQFSREWSLRAIVDYNALAPNTALVADARTRHADLDLLLTWLLRPGTALYIGYTDGYDNVRLDPQAGVEPTANALSSTGRQVFIKSSWAIRF